MSDRKQRSFEDSEAARERVPLLIGLVGPSGSGKTFSALRLATGIAAETKAGIYGIDTEARRMLHYADTFKFRHLDFKAPFSPLDYLAAIEHCAAKAGPGGVIIVDSQSHEHDGPGGVLEMHESELNRLAGENYEKRDKMKYLAWVGPKGQRVRLINSILQMNMNFIFCFRAKEKLKLKAGEKPVFLGWQPIAGDEFIYEMTMNLLLYPNSGGVPQTSPAEPGERAMLKIPQQFRGLGIGSSPLDEAMGQKLAQWATGGLERSKNDERADLLAKLLSHLKELHPTDDEAGKQARMATLIDLGLPTAWTKVKELPIEQLRAMKIGGAE